MDNAPRQHWVYRVTTGGWRRARPVVGVLVLSAGLTACTTIEGYPENPADDDALIASLKPYLAGAHDAEHQQANTPADRKRIRDQIVLSDIRLYDIEFDRFERSLYAAGSSISTGTDLAALLLNGLGATTGNASTKAALAAAAGGLTGAHGTISKDLFYQNTLPAILAQMEANRTQLKSQIFKSLLLGDDDYPLLRAQLDLDELARVGSIPRAINGLTQTATDADAAARAQIDQIRILKYGSTSTTKLIVAWLYLNGESAGVKAENQAALENWMANDTKDKALSSIPWTQLVWGTSDALEADRARAIDALKIPKTP